METDGKYNSKALEKLLYRRQYILGPYFIEKLASWKRINICKSICLTVHPELEVYQTVQ